MRMSGRIRAMALTLGVVRNITPILKLHLNAPLNKARHSGVYNRKRQSSYSTIVYRKSATLCYRNMQCTKRLICRVVERGQGATSCGDDGEGESINIVVVRELRPGLCLVDEAEGEN